MTVILSALVVCLLIGCLYYRSERNRYLKMWDEALTLLENRRNKEDEARRNSHEAKVPRGVKT